MRIELSRRRLLGLGGAALAGVALAGCATEPPAAEFPELRFQDRPPFRLQAAVVDVVDETAPDASAMDWASVFPTLPRTAMRNWGQDRLEAEPAALGLARFRITEAAIEHSVGEAEPGLFKPGRREKFLIRVAAILEVRGNDGRLVRSVSGKSWGDDSIAVDAKPWDRKRAINALVERVMADFDREMEAAIRANMADLLL